MNFFASMSSWWNGLFDKRLWESNGSSRSTTARQNVSEETALNYSAVWCATKLLCGTGASLPLPMFDSGDGDQRLKDREHPLYRILNIAPNPEMTAYSFRSIMWQWQVNWGNAYAEIVREGNMPDGQVVYLWPLHPARVEACRDPDDNLYYKVRNEDGTSPTELESWQMLHIPSIITSDGISGRGVITHARETIGAAIGAEKYGANWFGGAGVPRVVIEHTGTWDPAQREAFRKEWDEIHAGPDGHRIALLMGGAKAVPLSLSAEDSQFIETRYLGIEEMARWYGIPPHLLHHLLRATFNNIEELGISFVQYGLIPWLRVWEQCITQKLLTPEEQLRYFAEHNVDALLRGSAAARAAFYQVMTNAAIMSRNECRKKENLDPVDGGDTFLVQGATVPLDEDGRPESEFATSTPSSPAMPDTTDGESQDLPASPDEDSKTSTMVSFAVKRIISHDLSRFLTKETKAIASFARKPGQFMTNVEEFYAQHAVLVRDQMTNTLGALSACGLETSVDNFVTTWVKDGKKLAIDASGTATPDELAVAVQNMIESRTWTERPQRAVESIQ